MGKPIDEVNLSRNADHFIIAELVGKIVTVKDVLIELFLPRHDEEEVFLYCKPNSQQYNELNKEFEFSIIGHDEFSDGSINNKFYVKRAFLKKSQRSFYTSKLGELNIVLQAYDLMIICERDNKKENSVTEGFFTFFNRFVIPPLKLIRRKANGEVTFDSSDRYSFTLQSGLKLTFDTYYRYEDFGDYEKSSPYSVAEFKTDIDPAQINEIVNETDDFLLLLSFALGKICICTGWVASSNSKIVKYFRRDKAIPSKSEKNSFSDQLVETYELKSFLEHTYKYFINFNNRELLRNILYPVVRENKISVETRYLILFAILESIILDYKKSFGYEIILDEDLFNELKIDLKELIKSKLLSIDKDRRKFIYEKLPELNRVSFTSSLALFQKHYKIKLDDLWPLSDSKDGASLSDIRNKIIHGEIFNYHQSQAISYAVIHLQIIVERMILSLLDWDISKSTASADYNKHFFAKENEKIKFYQQSLLN